MKLGMKLGPKTLADLALAAMAAASLAACASHPPPPPAAPIPPREHEGGPLLQRGDPGGERPVLLA
jgi:ABC-type uncharacterized transport system auxiliary subunit